MKNRRTNYQNKFKEIATTIVRYCQDIEYNTFRAYQLSKFSALLLFGAVYFVFINDILTADQWKWFWKLMGMYFAPFAGKETVIPLGIYEGIPPVIWGASIVIFDIITFTTVLTNWWFVEACIRHSKLASKAYTKLQDRTAKLQKRRSSKLLYAFLFLFMVIPFQLTGGALSTCILGILLGIKKSHISIIIVLGSIVSTTITTLAVMEIFKVL